MKEEKPCLCKEHIKQYVDLLLKEKKNKKKGGKRSTLKNRKHGGSGTLLGQFIKSTNQIDYNKSFDENEPIFLEMQRLLKQIQTNTQNILDLVVNIRFSNGVSYEYTAYSYLLYSFLRNYDSLMEKKKRNKNSISDTKIEKFYKNYMMLFLFFFLEYT